MLTVADDIAFYRTINTPSRKIGRQKIAAIKAYAESHSCSAYNALKSLVKEDAPLFKGTGASQYINAIQNVQMLLPSVTEAPVLHKKLTLSDILQMLLDQSGYEAFLRTEADQERLDNVAEFKRGMYEASLDDDATLESFLSHIALFTDLDREDSADAVKMLTIHAAKGMEFPIVFLCGMNEGVFPSRKVNTPEDMEEERRIAYVAMTRAKQSLYISDAEGKANDGIFKYPSRFIFNAGLENFNIVSKLDASFTEQAQKVIAYEEKRLDAMRTMFAKGDRVHHPVFGNGTVTLVNTTASCYIIQFDSMQTERSILFTANLTPPSKD